MPDTTPNGTLRFERRCADRWPAGGVATAHRSGGDRFGDAYRLRLIDRSCEGLGAVCNRPIEPGAVVAVGFGAPGEPVRPGVVLRCLPCGDGYRLAIRFDRLLAA